MSAADDVILSFDKDGVGHMWDLKTRAVLTSYKEADTRTVAIAGDRNTLISAPDMFLTAPTSRAAINIYSMYKDTPLYRCAAPESITEIAISSCSTYIVAGGTSGKAFVWDALSGELLRSWNAHYKAVSALAFSPCGTLIASGGNDGIIHVWTLASIIDYVATADLATAPKPVATWSEHALPIHKVVFGPGLGMSARVYSASADKTVKAWSISSKSSIITLSFSAAVTSLCVSPLETSAFCGCSDGTISRVDIHASVVTKVSPDRFIAGSTRSFRANNDDADAISSIAAAVAASGASLETAAHALFLGHVGAVTALSMSRDGLRLVSGGVDSAVRIWDVDSRQVLATFDGHKAPVLALRTISKPLQAKTVGSKHLYPQTVAPLKKYAVPVAIDWKDTTTGPPSDVTVARCTPSSWDVGTSHRMDVDFKNAVDCMLGAISLFSAAPDSAGAPIQGNEDIEAMKATIEELRSENARWKNVNTALLEKLKTGDATSSDASGIKRKREAER